MVALSMFNPFFNFKWGSKKERSESVAKFQKVSITFFSIRSKSESVFKKADIVSNLSSSSSSHHPQHHKYRHHDQNK